MSDFPKIGLKSAFDRLLVPTGPSSQGGEGVSSKDDADGKSLRGIFQPPGSSGAGALGKLGDAVSKVDESTEAVKGLSQQYGSAVADANAASSLAPLASVEEAAELVKKIRKDLLADPPTGKAAHAVDAQRAHKVLA